MPGGVVFDQGNVNVAALTAPGAYVQIIPPLGMIIPLPTNAVAVAGTASWGPVNKPLASGSPTTSASQFGQFNASLNDPYDLARDTTIAFQQAQSAASLTVWQTRISDGTDAAATVTLLSSAQATNTETATLGGTAANSNVINVTFTNASISGSPVTISYTLTGTDTLNSAATALAAAINASTALAVAGITAAAVGAVVTITYPQSLGTVTFGQSVTGSTTVTLAAGSTGTAQIAGLKLSGKWTGIGGNNITVQITAGSKTNTFNVNIIASYAGLQSEFYPNIPGTVSTFWQNLANAINNGLSNVRGPSQLVVASNVSISALAPALSSGNGFALTGGSDGRSGVTSSSFFGSDVIGNRQGIYCFRNLSPTPTFFWCAGLTDTTKFASMQILASQEIMIAMLPFAVGTSTSTAISTKQSLGIDDYRVCFIKDWVYWTDPISGQQLLVSPAPFAAARIASLSPELSPINVAVFGVNGTERNGPSGNQNYDMDEIGLLNVNGILAITNPVPGGSYWGFPVGNNSSSDPVRAPIEYSRMIDYIALSLAARMGKYVGKLQGQTDPDPTRMAVKGELDEFGNFLKYTTRQIDDFYSVCDLSNNTPGPGGTIARRYLFANFFVRLLASIQFVVINLQGGMNVNTTPSSTPSGTITNP